EVKGYTNIESTTDPRQVLSLFKTFDPDIILLDLMMPYLTGFQVMEQLKPLIPASCYMPILVLTADVTVDAKQRALAGGAKDFLTKPFDLIEVDLRIGNLLETRFLYQQLKNQNEILEEKVKERTFELEKTNIELITAKDKAEESDRLKTYFLNNISHEIRTPFNGILGFLAVLEENSLTASERAEYTGIINKSSYRLMNTINDIVEISQIQAGQIKLSVSETNIRRLTSGVYDQFKTEAESKGLKLFINSDLPINIDSIHTDSAKLNTILTILIGNAVKFTKTGSIEIGIREDAGFIEFFVKDTGVGIPENRQQTIFERFMQADGSNTRQFEGSGLGLSIAKAYVEMLGGNIWIESNPEGESGGKGSKFYFTLPYNGDPQEEINPKNEILAESEENQNGKLKILIAEDDESSANFLTIIVRQFGNEILNATTGIEAVEACRDNPDIDLVLMDVQMPEMNGYEATRQIRQFNKEVIIIAQTAFGLIGDQEKAIDAGCNDYISKPIKKDQLSVLLQKYGKK
ncbi:MAG: response regulator, partial [Bacteroidota bacterium]